METLVQDLLNRMKIMTHAAQDNLLSVKVSQAFQANKSCSSNFPFDIGDHVVLSMLHCCRDFRANDPNCVTKFMPQFDGLFRIKNTDKKHSTVTLDLPNLPNIFPIFHTSEVWPFVENDDLLFPSRSLVPPYPITVEGQQEFFIDKIVDEKKCGKTLYQVCWQGEGPEGDLWLPAKELSDCKALDIWITKKSTFSTISYVCSTGPAGSFSPTGFLMHLR